MLDPQYSASNNPWANLPAGHTDDFSDLDSYAGDYKAQHAFAAGVDTLPNGDYDCVVESAALDRIGADRVVRINLSVHTGARVEWLHWLNKQQGVNAFAADLCVLGFDADRWGPANNRPLSAEIPKAVAAMKGIRFRANKSSRPGSGLHAGKTFHDFRVSCRLDGRPMPPLAPAASAVQTPAPGARPQQPAHPGPVYAGQAPGGDDGIPF